VHSSIDIRWEYEILKYEVVSYYHQHHFYGFTYTNVQDNAVVWICFSVGPEHNLSLTYFVQSSNNTIAYLESFHTGGKSHSRCRNNTRTKWEEYRRKMSYVGATSSDIFLYSTSIDG
jgi:hypothetical protein